jgi:antitoxin ChpS
MPTANLRRVGGSVMVAVPPAYLEHTGLGPNAPVAWEIEGDRLIMRPAATRPRYTLAELLAQCDQRKRRPRSDADWTSGGPVGRELI